MLMFRRGLCKMHGEAHVDGVLVAEADLSAVIVDRDEAGAVPVEKKK